MKLLQLVVLTLFLVLDVVYARPCRSDETPGNGCEDRFRPCSELDATASIQGYIKIGVNENTDCMNNSPRLRDTIKSGKNNKYYVQFDDKWGNCYGILMDGGECWGTNPINNGNYDCLGRCGPGCGTWACSNWGRDCLKHDVCGYYFNAEGGAADDHCGDEFDQAQNDWGHCCVWPCARKCKGQSNSC